MNYGKVKKAIENTYTDLCTVTEHSKTANKETKLAEWNDTIVTRNQPCRLSFQQIKSTQADGSAEAVIQSVKLFISPDISIKPGSKISVTRQGMTTDYASSGVPAVYPTHQEIMLSLFERWA